MSVLLELAETETRALVLGNPARRASLPEGCIGNNGLPGPAAEGVIAAILAELGADGGPVTLLLPPRLVRTRCVQLDVPIDGPITHAHLSDAHAALADCADLQREATLYAQPGRYLIDGVPTTEDPTGHRCATLSIEVPILTANLSALAALEKAIVSGGATLTDVITPQVPSAAAFIGETQTGAVLVFGHGETLLLVAAEDRLQRAATIPIGFRHLVGDLMKTLDVGAAEARESVAAHQLLRAQAKRLEDAIIKARLDELCEAIIDRASDLTRDFDVTFVARAGSPGAEHVLPALIDELPDELVTADQTSGDDPYAVLQGAASVLEGLRGGHEPASLSLRAEGQRRHAVLQWLVTHF